MGKLPAGQEIARKLPAGQEIARKLFQRLTEKGTDQQGKPAPDEPPGDLRRGRGRRASVIAGRRPIPIRRPDLPDDARRSAS
jgi:hypothetical protein